MKKIKRIVTLLICAALLLCSCGQPSQSVGADTASKSTDATLQTSEAATEATAAELTDNVTDAEQMSEEKTIVWPDPGIDGNQPKTASPKEDFCYYANSEWYNETTLPDGYSIYTAIYTLSDSVKKQVIDMLENPSDSEASVKTSQLYDSFMDTQTRDGVQCELWSSLLERLNNVSTIDELTALYTDDDNALFAFTGFLNAILEVDLKDSSAYALYIAAPTLSLSDSAEYTEMTEQGKRYKSAYEKFYMSMLTHNGFDETTAQQMIDDASAFEQLLSSSIYPLSTSYRSDYYELIYNPYTADELNALSPNFPLMETLRKVGYDNLDKYVVCEPEAIKAMNAAYTEENLPKIKAYLTLSLFSTLACYGDTFSENAYNTLTNEKNGSSGNYSDSIRAYNVCNKLLGELMGQAYTEKYFDEQTKTDVTDFANKIIAAYEKRLSDADWITDATRQTAIEKLNAMALNIGYPEHLAYDWSKIDISADKPLLENVMNIVIQISKQNAKRAGAAVDNKTWSMSANTVNAFYDPMNNSINFPAAILQAPFYDKNAPDSANLGAIGVIIAHEISHAFDTKGSQFDKDGNMSNWWTDEDRAAFTERTDKVAARYAAIEVIDGEHVQGDLTIGETVADLVAMSSTLDIMKTLSDADYDAYFRAFASVWTRIITPEYCVYYLRNDPHAPSYLRANITVQQFDEFYETYGVTEGDFMYTAPENRLRVW